MAGAHPLLFRYEGDGDFKAANAHHARKADELYVVHELYRLDQISERSPETHKHFFAALKEGWQNLPEHLHAIYPTPEHLRKKALIKAGYFDSHSIVCRSAAEARKVAAFIAPIDEFGVVLVQGATVTRFTAKSQSYRAMGKKVFQESKQAVLDVVADMIDVGREELQRNAGRAA